MKLFIIHGWAYSIEPWQNTVDNLREQGVEVVQLKVPGLTEPSNEIWTVEKYVAWLGEQLVHEDHPIVLGHSNGGRIAMHFDVEHLGKFRKLMLLNSAGIEIRSERLSVKRRIIRIAAKLLKPLKHIPGLKKLVYRLLGSDYGNAPKNMQATLAHMLASDRSFDATKVTAPTSILWGEADTTTPLAMGKKLHQLISQSTLKTIPDWHHAPYRTHPEQLATEILKILEDTA